jgi:replicative DNA helicase
MNRDLVLPNDENTESAILCRLIVWPNDRDEIFDHTQPDDFYTTLHRLVYLVAHKLHHAGVNFDLNAIVSTLSDEGKLSTVGGAHKVAEIVDSAMSVSIVHDAARLRGLSLRRWLITGAERIRQTAERLDVPADEALEVSQGIILELSQSNLNSQSVTVAESLQCVIETSEAAYREGGKISKIQTGLIDWDRTTGGLGKKQLILIAARPGMGKTALVINNFAVRAAKDSYPVHIFSFEMSSDEITYRMLAAETGIPTDRIEQGKLSNDEWREVNEAASKLHDLPIVIEDVSGITYSEVWRRARRVQARRKTALVVVDYIQLVRGDKKNGRVEEVSSVSRALKVLAKELCVPVVACCQLNREIESRQDPIPKLSDLRESGALEQDADIVTFISPGEIDGTMTLRTEKHRNGPRGKAEVIFFKERMVFSNKA